MKKIIVFIMALALSLSLVACGGEEQAQEQETTSNEQTQSVEEAKDVEEEKLEDVEEEKLEDVIVTITDKVNVPENYDISQYSDRVEFTFLVDNNSDKDIKGIQGVLEIYDLFGEGILSINADLTGETISSMGELVISGKGMDINEFKDEHVKLYNENFDDLNFNYIVNNIVYADSQSQQNATTSEGASNNVDIAVTNKYNLTENYDVGRYSPRVQMDFEITNNESKDIKGIQGVLHIKDMFSANIMSMNCDFTGQTISANETIAITDLGLDINEFKDDHIKLYNELYEDLIFEYEITSIVYTDGTIAN